MTPNPTPASEALSSLDKVTLDQQLIDWYEQHVDTLHRALKQSAAIESGELFNAHDPGPEQCAKSYIEGNNDLLERLKQIGGA